MSVAVRAYVGVGANLGDARAQVARGIAALRALPHTRLAASSSLYASAPIDAPGPPYVNAVVALDTTLTATALLHALQGIETQHGRTRTTHNAPRTLDLDVLLYGTQRSGDPALTLPHPRLHLRAFVLKPLLEIAPRLQVDGLGALTTWLQRAGDQQVTRLADEKVAR